MRHIRLTSPRFYCGLAAAALACLALAAPWALAAPDVSDKQAEADRIRSEMANINQSAEQAVERYNQASVELDTTKQQMSANERSLSEASQSLNEAQQRLGQRLESIYREGSLSFVDVIFNSNTFSEFVSRFDLLGKLGSQDKSDIDQVLLFKRRVESAQGELDQARSRQEELLGTLAAEQSQIESQLAARQTLLAGVEGEVAQLLAQQQQQQQAQATSVVLPVATPGAGSAPAPEPEPAPGPAPAPAPAPEPEPAPAPAPPPSSGGAVSIAMQYLGVPYVWGGASPSGFDCSGLVMYVYAQLGIYLPHSAAAQYYSGTPISYGELAPGDLVFFGSPISHVGIYIGGGSMIHAPFEGAVVSITSVGYGGSYAGACRL